jgi:hypothetical protein
MTCRSFALAICTFDLGVRIRTHRYCAAPRLTCGVSRLAQLPLALTRWRHEELVEPASRDALLGDVQCGPTPCRSSSRALDAIDSIMSAHHRDAALVRFESGTGTS